MRSAGSAGEYVEDEVGAVNDAAVEFLLNVAHLAGCELIVEDSQGDLIGCNKTGNLRDLATVDKCAGICMFNAL